MRYAYKNLGKQRQDSTVIVRWTGAAADVLLLDPVNFSKYCRDRNLVFREAGGHYRRSPARLSIPQDGRWYIVVDFCGYSTHANASVEVQMPDDREPQTTRDEALVGL